VFDGLRRPCPVYRIPLSQPQQNRSSKNHRRIREVTPDFIIVGIGSLCLGLFSIFTWISSSTGTFLNEDQVILPLERTPIPSETDGEIELRTQLKPPFEIDRFIKEELSPGDELYEGGSVSDLESLHNVIAPFLPLDFHENTGREVVEVIYSFSGKEVIGPSFHSSGKEVIEYFGNSGGEGGLTNEAGNGGLARDEILGAMGEEGKRGALPYFPAGVGAGAGFEIIGGNSLGSNTATGNSGSNGGLDPQQSNRMEEFDGSGGIALDPSGSGNSGTRPSGGQSGNVSTETSAPEGQRSFRSIPPVLTADSVISGNTGASLSSGSSGIQSGSAGTPGSILSEPQLQPLPPASIPAASIGGGVGGGTPVSSGNSNSFTGTSGSSQGNSSLSSPGNRPDITPILPVAVPPQIAVGGATGGAPSVGGNLLPIPAISSSGTPGRSPANRGSTISPAANSAPSSSASSNSNSGLSGEPASLGLGRGNGGSLPPLLPVVTPIAGGGAAGGGIPAAIPPPLPIRGNENPDPSNEENHDDLPEQCIPWIVQEGQTIKSLAAASGTTTDVIMRINETAMRRQ